MKNKIKKSFFSALLFLTVNICYCQGGDTATIIEKNVFNPGSVNSSIQNEGDSVTDLLPITDSSVTNQPISSSMDYILR